VSDASAPEGAPATQPPAEGGGREVCPGAKAVLDDFELLHGEVLLPEARFEHWLDELEETPSRERDQLAHDLIALAIRFRKSGLQGADRGFSQLCALAVMVVEDLADLPTDGFEQARTRSVTSVPAPPAALPDDEVDGGEGSGTSLRDLLLRR
jgi:hypothetical protein